ncbi:hypothetical protein RUM44_010121 [Polyplax serrata]|uniref:Uncharacterized protein n=1 Tax=Polyplax serrata TaxID=468196 RepID=A0ABR1AUP1_POLSC
MASSMRMFRMTDHNIFKGKIGCSSSNISNEEFKKLQQIASFLQKRVEEVYQPSAASETDVLREPSRTNQAPPFEFNLEEKNPRSDDSSVFAVRPSDPRYFQGFQNVLGTNTVRSSSRGETEKVKHPEVTSESFDFFGGNDEGGDFSMGSDVQQVPITSISEEERRADIYFAAIVVGCSTAAVVATIAIGISCYR